MSFHNSIYFLRERLDKYSDLLPVFCFLGSGIVLLMFCITGHESENLMMMDFYIRSTCDCSLVLLILMFAKSKSYKLISWMAYIGLCILFFVNILYVTFNLSPDIYYMLFVLAIYAIFVIVTVAKLTNRC